MGINSTYKLIKGSIVAFVLKYVPVYNENAPPPVFPTILGTGFVVRENGIVATNAHVVRMFSKVWCPSDAPKNEWPITALMFKATERGILEIPLEVIAVAILSGFDPGGKAYYGPKEGPDLAFVYVRARGLPTAQIDSKTLIEEGMEIGTAGFPMGT